MVEARAPATHRRSASLALSSPLRTATHSSLTSLMAKASEPRQAAAANISAAARPMAGSLSLSCGVDATVLLSDKRTTVSNGGCQAQLSGSVANGWPDHSRCCAARIT